MKFYRIVALILAFILQSYLVIAQNADPTKGPVEFGGTTVYGNGFSLGSDGSSLFCTNCNGKIGNHDVSGDFSGEVTANSFSGTSGADGLTLSGKSIPPGAEFQLDMKTGKLEVIAPEGGKVSLLNTEVDLNEGSILTLETDGSIHTKGTSEIKDSFGNLASGENIVYNPNDQTYKSDNSLRVKVADGKEAFGKSIAVSVGPMTLQEANSFLERNPNSAALNVVGNTLTKQKGIIGVTTTENGLSTTTHGLKLETIISRQPKEIIYEYAGSEKAFARTDIDYEVNGQRFTAITLQRIGNTGPESYVFAPSINPTAIPNKKFSEIRVNEVELIAKGFPTVTGALVSYSPIEMMEVTSKSEYFGGEFYDEIKAFVHMPLPKLTSHSYSIQDHVHELSGTFEVPVSGTLKTRLDLDYTQLSVQDFKSGNSWEKNFAAFLQEGDYKVTTEISHSAGSAASYTMIDRFMDGFEVSGINDPSQSYYQNLKLALNEKIAGGSVFMTMNPKSGSITFAKNVADPSPLTVVFPQQLATSFRRESVQSLAPLLTKNIPQDTRLKLEKTFAPN